MSKDSALHSLPSSSHKPYSIPAYLAPSTSSFSIPLRGSVPPVVIANAWRPPVVVAPQVPPPKKRSPEEEEIISATAARFQEALKQDHAALVNIDTTPFKNTLDMVHRLLPFHVLCQPREDRKGKRKASDSLEAEISETKVAIECAKRKRKLDERFRRARIRPGKRLAPADQEIGLASMFADDVRAEISAFTSEIRVARARLDNERRAKIPPQGPPPPPSYPTYAYQQTYPGQTVFSAVPAPQPTLPLVIPVQLPRKMLAALNAANIHPVDASSLVPGTPHPPAVLRSTSEDGESLILEFSSQLLPIIMSLLRDTSAVAAASASV
ncbi:Chloride channel protein [Mycena indigotica]|uniref:Chloride channel protein n=1 Tax=Mycena indigotica TaxID=2126181 RepID=A0A8H6WED2_9AGAR|nr:Chloride channel protein [Mycena indigotica]KAF7315599.1 Chloride channel protein [Mycena indigotica]